MLALSNDPVWFCLRAEPKREHLAATALRRRFQIECLSPRLRFRKLTQRGPVWFVEAMFPGYLFAKFVYSTQHLAVESSHGVRGILRFGERLATLAEDTVICPSVKGGRRRSRHCRFLPKNWPAGSTHRRTFSGTRGARHPAVACKRTDPSAARVSGAVAGDGSSCGKSAPNVTGDAVTKDKVAVQRNTLPLGKYSQRLSGR